MGGVGARDLAWSLEAVVWGIMRSKSLMRVILDADTLSRAPSHGSIRPSSSGSPPSTARPRAREIVPCRAPGATTSGAASDDQPWRKEWASGRLGLAACPTAAVRGCSRLFKVVDACDAARAFSRERVWQRRTTRHDRNTTSTASPHPLLPSPMRIAVCQVPWINRVTRETIRGSSRPS